MSRLKHETLFIRNSAESKLCYVLWSGANVAPEMWMLGPQVLNIMLYQHSVPKQIDALVEIIDGMDEREASCA